MYFSFNVFMDLIFYNQRSESSLLSCKSASKLYLFHALVIERGIMNFKRIWWTDATNFEGTFDHLWTLRKMVKSLAHPIVHVMTYWYWEFKAGIIACFREVVWATTRAGPKSRNGQQKIFQFINFKAHKKWFYKTPAY